MDDQDLITDIDTATERLKASLKLCRRIVDSYQSNLVQLARNNAGLSDPILGQQRQRKRIRSDGW